jgi:PAS domain S-box-containing protein
VHDEQGRFIDVNEQSCIDLGYSREELLSLTINDISWG